jgi:DNA-binding NarL/FixJ family response regulator
MDTNFGGKILSARIAQLTHRETQILALVTDGLKNKEIAQALRITEGTVKSHISRLFWKAGVRSRFELALFGLTNRPAVQVPARLTVVARRAGSSA